MASETGKLNHRKPYHPKQSRWWWTGNSFFLRYMLREATSIFVMLFSLELIYSLLQLSQGPDNWNQWLATLAQPLFIVFNLIVLAAAIYHAATWFKLAPKIMVLRLGDWKLPEKIMVSGQWLGMIVFTAALISLFIMTGGHYAN